MSFFNIFKRNKEEILVAPCTGTVLDLSQVPDPVFAEKVIGDGVAIDPKGTTVLSPCDGTVGKIFDTNHAFHIISPMGLEIFVHVGVNTIALKGQGFKRLVKEGTFVKKGTPVLELDLEFLKANSSSVLIPIIIANSDEKVASMTPKLGQIQAGQDLLEIKLK